MEAGIDEKAQGPEDFQPAPDEEDIAEQKEVAQDEGESPPEDKFPPPEPDREHGGCSEDQGIGQGKTESSRTSDCGGRQRGGGW